MQFTVGDGQLIAGFEQAIIGMKVGESVTVEIPAAEAYGPHREELVFEVDRAEFPADLEPEVGQQLVMEQGAGNQTLVLVVAVSESSVTMDANHSLAGEDLTFEIQLVDII